MGRQWDAGWYPDGTGQMRWWDGDGWTENVQVPVLTAPPASFEASGYALRLALLRDGDAHPRRVFALHHR